MARLVCVKVVCLLDIVIHRLLITCHDTVVVAFKLNRNNVTCHLRISFTTKLKQWHGTVQYGKIIVAFSLQTILSHQEASARQLLRDKVSLSLRTGDKGLCEKPIDH